MSNELTNSPIQTMRKLLKEDPRYKYEAYQFVREALQFGQQLRQELPESIGVENDLDDDGFPAETVVRSAHVTGQELCESCRLYAIEQFGLLAQLVLGKWGVCSTSDFGEIVYNLIRIEQMRKSDSDRRQDFDNVYSFESAFEPDFRLNDNSSFSC
ncbi:Minf_1886 family protein [Planctomycetes bacterium SV_7m_r]